jgi:hypothetical protein
MIALIALQSSANRANGSERGPGFRGYVASITIRQLDDGLKRACACAARSGRSMEDRHAPSCATQYQVAAQIPAASSLLPSQATAQQTRR